MKYYTHLAFSFLIGILLIKYFGFKNQILFIFLFLLFSLIPDIDEIKSKISGKFKVLAWIISFFIGHRGLLHSIWMPILIYLLLFMVRMDIAIAASFGYLSHIVLDCFNVSGVKLLWPLQKKLKGFIPSGGLAENLIFLGLVVLDVYVMVGI